MQTEEDRKKFLDLCSIRMKGGVAPPPEAPRINAYCCNVCGHHELVVDTAEGTTPMTLPCMSASDSKIIGLDGSKAHQCSGSMISSWYSLLPGDVKLEDVHLEWRSPSLGFYKSLLKKNKQLADHVAKGGLTLHKRTDPNRPLWAHGDFYVHPDGTRLTEDESLAMLSGIEKLRGFVRMEIQLLRRKVQQEAKARQKRIEKRRSKKRRS